jgi:hypothetical protein|tara:strand:+ start:330 stop:722 length:393 start_codon:yes stop_codon:yes gene_type:complete
MKISKTRLKEIIKEELSGLGESDETIVSPNQNAQIELQSLANQLSAPENFVSMVRQAIAAAASTHADAEAQALGFMIEALHLLLPQQPDTEDPVVDDAEALVLGKDGPPSPEKVAQLRRQLKHGFEKWRK